jgi:hypothetical protein
MEEFEHQGFWWLPGKPEEQVPGTLKFDPDEGATLSLLGSLDNQMQFGTPFDPELVLGISSGGKLITLQGCVQTRSTMTLPGFPISSLRARMTFVGEHFEDPSDIGFEGLSVGYSHLEEWAGVSGFVLKMTDDPKAYPCVIEHMIPDAVSVSAGDAKVALRFGSKHKHSNPLVREASITQNARITLDHPEKKPLNDLLKAMYHIQNFLTLGVGKPVYPLVIRGIAGTDGGAEVEVYYRPLGRISSAVKKVHPAYMLFTFHDLDDFGRSLDAWLKKVEVLEPVYQLYFGTLYNPRSYIRHQFLSLIQALEAYHRRVNTSSDLPEEEHAKRIKEILGGAPEEHRKWLEGKLTYSNEPSLRRRLKEIHGRYPESVGSIVGDSRSFIQKVVTTRNYNTHFDKRLEGQAAREGDLHGLTQKLNRLLEVCLLGEIGFDDRRIRDLLTRKR